MTSEPENFDSLRRLLALKRHEQPPPGFFNQFSTEVIARIKAGDRGEPESIFARLFFERTWWEQLRAALLAKPGLVGGFGAAVCALLISGIILSENTPSPVAQNLVPSDSSSSFFTTASAATSGDSLDQAEFSYSSTNPLAPAGSSLFDQYSIPKTQPVSLEIPTGN